MIENVELCIFISDIVDETEWDFVKSSHETSYRYIGWEAP